MTHPTDEELDALVGMLQQRDKSKHGYTGHPLYNRNGSQAAAVITALRAQLAEVQAELHGPIKRLSAQDYSNVIAHLSPELEPNGELPNRNSLMMALVEATNAARKDAARADRADRAEAALAAQVEVAIREVWGCCEDLEDEAHAKLKLVATDHEQGFWRGQKMTAKRIRRATPMPTNDRTALDRMLRAEREKALQDLAKTIRGWRNDVPMTGEECANAILALIEGGKP